MVYAGCRIGARAIIHSGVVIGADGFGIAKEGGRWLKIPQIGAVAIGDDVEIGANCAIDRGTIRDTRIGSGSKLDNLVHVGHNVEIGRDCLLCGQVGIAGSARIGDRVVLGGQCGVNDNIFVGNDVIAGGATKIFTNAPAGRVLLGYPAVRMETHVEMQKALRRLPRLAARVAELEKVISLLPRSG